ncbi:UvrB/UvrC motif-containing protein [Botrimarina hoheduenensis]|uniref:UvrB/uvrC motif protein n=1 Tax=Botrimarina hoheduenensis TaxID=2528000 RepID=A0A5C5VWQ3_9BACT|nr:UvrB/UvrC motif-containing protein [Botrimarina hoheduenensis]TWT42537.1 UvrB/uvrC motif protein [Botrimarina hoheduenensis]
MKCQKCDRPATFHITDLVDGKAKEVHLCEECAKEFLSPLAAEAESVVPQMAGLLAQQLAVGQTAEELARLDERVCPVCGISFLEFRKQGRLGCPHDYVHFAKEIEPLLVNIHGETHHVGKTPRHSGADTEHQTQLIRLRREMKEAVAKEDYERASVLRDEIHAIEQAPHAETAAHEPPPATDD